MTEKQETMQPLTVSLPDGNKIHSTHTGLINIPRVPRCGRVGHVIPGLSKYSLVSVVVLCNAGCDVMFTKIGVTVKYRGRVVLNGKKCTRTGLWMVPLIDTSPPKIEENTTYDTTTTNKTSTYNTTKHDHQKNRKDIDIGRQEHTNLANALIPTSTRAELAQYYHQCMGSPPKSALLRVLRNHPNELETFPGLNKNLIMKHLPPSKATAKGHMVRVRKGLNSTRSNKKNIQDARDEVDDMDPQEQEYSAFDNEMFCFVVTRNEQNKTIYSDLTGRFPVESYSGMNYLLVVYVYHLNAPMIRAIKSRKDEDMVNAFRSIYQELKTLGHRPSLHAEVAIKAVKYHFLAHLATTDPSCPLQIWCKYVRQVQDTLLVLRTSRIGKGKSAYEALYNKKFNFNSTPIAPIGNKAVAFIAPDDRNSWQPHAIDAWYTGPAPDHYRLLKFFNPQTGGMMHTGTYQIFPAHCEIPTISEGDLTIAAAADIMH